MDASSEGYLIVAHKDIDEMDNILLLKHHPSCLLNWIENKDLKLYQITQDKAIEIWLIVICVTSTSTMNRGSPSRDLL